MIEKQPWHMLQDMPWAVLFNSFCSQETIKPYHLDGTLPTLFPRDNQPVFVWKVTNDALSAQLLKCSLAVTGPGKGNKNCFSLISIGKSIAWKTAIILLWDIRETHSCTQSCPISGVFYLYISWFQPCEKEGLLIANVLVGMSSLTLKP